MSPSAIEYLRHVLQEMDYLAGRAGGLSKDEFLRDETLKRAFVRSLEVIGEATKRLPTEVTSRYGDIDWRAMAGMRDRLIHGYFGVDYDIVWDVIANKLPALRGAIEQIIRGQGE